MAADLNMMIQTLPLWWIEQIEIFNSLALLPFRYDLASRLKLYQNPQILAVQYPVCPGTNFLLHLKDLQPVPMVLQVDHKKERVP